MVLSPCNAFKHYLYFISDLYNLLDFAYTTDRIKVFLFRIVLDNTLLSYGIDSSFGVGCEVYGLDRF